MLVEILNISFKRLKVRSVKTNSSKVYGHRISPSAGIVFTLHKLKQKLNQGKSTSYYY